MKDYINNLIDFIYESPCSYFAIQNSINKLEKAGFKHLEKGANWNLEKNGKYFLTKNSSSLIAFSIGENLEEGFKIICSHTDSPSFMLKPNGEILGENCLKLNIEGYGGMIISTWLDRPLSLAGRVVLKGDSVFSPISINVNFNRPVAIIPNLAIHLNRSVNEGHKYSKQNEMLPILSLAGEDFNKENFFINMLSKEINCKPEEIMYYELFLYEYEKGSVIGLNNEFVSSSRLDDLMMVYTSLEAFIKETGNSSNSVKVLFLADNEEVGSNTGQGADSGFLENTLKRICLNIFKHNWEENFYKMLENSIAISADLAHGVHPNYSTKHDITNRPLLNKGVCLKYSASQKYSTTGIGASVFKALCQDLNIPYQTFVNHSDAVGGGTIGPIISSKLNIPVIDMGVCIFSMHSIRELGATSDILDCFKLFCGFYK